MTEQNTHTFGCTGEAYDSCQCDESIKTGDILVIEGEGVVGLAWAWPIAVTEACGNFHTITQGSNASHVAEMMEVDRARVDAAVAVALVMGLPIATGFIE